MAIERVKKVPEVGANQMLIDVKAMAVRGESSFGECGRVIIIV